MPDTRITKDRLRNHLHYGKWIYVLIAAVAFFVVSLAYDMTEYTPDKHHRVDFQLVGNTILTDGKALEAVGQAALAAVKPRDGRLEAVNFYNIGFTGDDALDYYGSIKFTTMLAAGEGAVFCVDRALMERLAGQGGALPLDGYVESGALPRALGVTLPELDGDGNPTGASHVYALDLSGLGLMLSDDIGYDSRDKYAMVLASCVNPDTAAAVLNSVIEQLTGPAPDSEFARALAAAAAEASPAPAGPTGAP